VNTKGQAPFTEKFGKASKDARKLGCDVLQGLMGQMIKSGLFNSAVGPLNGQKEETEENYGQNFGKHLAKKAPQVLPAVGEGTSSSGSENVVPMEE
jgi:hypothetical protein